MNMQQDASNEFEKIISFLREEFSKIRTGRAHVSLVEGIQVEVYGTMTPINQLASISIPEPRTITITPWDKNILGSIEKVLQGSDLGVTPVNDGTNVRLNLPTLTEESRKELTKIVGKKSEEARVRVRAVRERLIKEVDREKETGEISEDDMRQKKQTIQKQVDAYNEKIESLKEEKEKEVMTV